MTTLSLARIVREELARIGPTATAVPASVERRTSWSRALPGFGLRSYPSGRSTYVLQAAIGGRTRTITIGNARILSDAEALDVARRILLRVQIGLDPAGDRQRTRFAPSFAVVLEQYAQFGAVTWKPSTYRTFGYYRRRYLDTAFASRFIDDIEPADVAGWFTSVTARSGPGGANRCFEHLRALMSKAEQWGYRSEGTNPCTGLRMNRRRKLERYLSEAELARLGEALRSAMLVDPQRATIILLLLLTGCRRSEIIDLRWSGVKGQRLLLTDSKTGPKTVWIGREAKDALSALPRRRGRNHVFWNDAVDRPIRTIQDFWAKLRTSAELPPLRVHDLRHSFASHAAARSETLPMIGKLLGHTKISTTARYAHLDDSLVGQAAEQVGQWILTAMGTSSGSGRGEPDVGVEQARTGGRLR